MLSEVSCCFGNTGRTEELAFPAFVVFSGGYLIWACLSGNDNCHQHLGVALCLFAIALGLCAGWGVGNRDVRDNDTEANKLLDSGSPQLKSYGTIVQQSVGDRDRVAINTAASVGSERVVQADVPRFNP